LALNLMLRLACCVFIKESKVMWKSRTGSSCFQVEGCQMKGGWGERSYFWPRGCCKACRYTNISITSKWVAQQWHNCFRTRYTTSDSFHIMHSMYLVAWTMKVQMLVLFLFSCSFKQCIATAARKCGMLS
jgi:hypothetical protein